jgi:ferredoxin
VNHLKDTRTIVEADESLCIGCDGCIRACPGGLITKEQFDGGGGLDGGGS